MEKIAVYGSGTIGSCEATLIIGHGIPCTVIGHSEKGLERCRKAVAQNWDDLIANGLAAEENKTAALALLTITNDPTALTGCTYVFEAVAEGAAEKQAVYETIAKYAEPGAVVASCSSSSFSGFAFSVKPVSSVMGIILKWTAPTLWDTAPSTTLMFLLSIKARSSCFSAAMTTGRLVSYRFSLSAL